MPVGDTLGSPFAACPAWHFPFPHGLYIMQAAILAEFGRSDVSESKLDDLHGIVAVLRVYQKHLRSTGLVEISWSHHSLPQHLQLATCYVTELLRMNLRGKHSLHDSISMFTLANKPTQGMDSGPQSNKFKRNKPSTVKKMKTEKLWVKGMNKVKKNQWNQWSTQPCFASVTLEKEDSNQAGYQHP